MRYIDVKEPGGPETLVMGEGEPPEPLANEVLIKVAAAGVNRPDVLQRQGLYPPPPDSTPILGLEVSGEVAGLGEKASRFQVGEKICALTNGGGYAEYVNVPETQCLPVPEGLSMVEAAALPETCFTVWSNVFDRAGLQPGESFLVHGGSSGIGTTAIQMARAFGAKVFTTAGSDEKCRACENLGAEIAINYKQKDFVEVLKSATDKRGVDVILDMVGGDYIPRNIKLAAMDGRIVSIAFLAGPTAEVNFVPVMLKRLTLTGSTLRPRSSDFKADIATSLREKVWQPIVSGQIRPQVFKVFPLDDAQGAHRLMEMGTHIGKIILLVENES
jgi:NADPH2:quinone reductase